MQTDLAFDDADLNAFVDGRIEPSRGAALAESLASDPETLARLDAWRRQSDSLRTMFSSVLFEPVPVRLLPLAVPLRPGNGDRIGGRGRPAPRPSSIAATMCVGAALIGFAVGALAGIGADGFGLMPSPSRGASPAIAVADDAGSLASRAAEAHRTFLDDLSRPLEIAASEEPRLTRWIARHLGPGVRVPDLARHGWSFAGARIMPGHRGPAAFLAYNNGADRLGLTVSHDDLSDEGFVVADDDRTSRLGVATWGEGGYGYALTSDHGRDWLARTLAPLHGSLAAPGRAGDGVAPAP